jgi:hypothetical protein
MDDADGDDGKQIQVRGGGAVCMRRVHAQRGAARDAATGLGCRALADPAACSAAADQLWGDQLRVVLLPCTTTSFHSPTSSPPRRGGLNILV